MNIFRISVIAMTFFMLACASIAEDNSLTDAEKKMAGFCFLTVKAWISGKTLRKTALAISG